MVEEKECYQCKNLKPLGDFTKYKQRKDGLSHLCKECRRERGIKRYWKNKDYFTNAHFKSNYGISINDVQEMQNKQDNLCGSCGFPPSKRGLFVDHDHRT